VTFALPLSGPNEAEGVSKGEASRPKAGAPISKKKGT